MTARETKLMATRYHLGEARRHLKEACEEMELEDQEIFMPLVRAREQLAVGRSRLEIEIKKVIELVD